MTIREILKSLPPADAELLRYGVEAGLTNQLVEYAPGRFVGVNIIPESMPHLVVEQTANAYAEGRILVRGCGEFPQ